MKKLISLLVFVLFASLSVVGQWHSARSSEVGQLSAWLKSHAAPIASTNPADTDFSDLKAFGEAVGNARIVMLGEQTHGEGSVYSLKVRLVKYLHEQKGFDVLVMESGMYDGAKIWQDAQAGASVAAEAPGSMFSMYARSKQASPVFAYIDAQRTTPHPLFFATLDTPHGGAQSQASLLPDLAAYLERNGLRSLVADPSWQGFSRTASKVIALQKPASGRDEHEFKMVMQSLKARLGAISNDSYVFPDSPGYWLNIVAGIEAQYEALLDRGNGNPRDRQMALDFEFLAGKVFPGRKLIIWTHNAHGLPFQDQMGQYLAKVYGDQMYRVIFTGATGIFLDFVSLMPVKIAMPPSDSWEAAWHSTGSKIAFVDLRGTRQDPKASAFLNSRLSLRAFNYHDNEFPGADVHNLANVVDGIFYIDQIEPAVLQPQSGTASAEAGERSG